MTSYGNTDEQRCCAISSGCNSEDSWVMLAMPRSLLQPFAYEPLQDMVATSSLLCRFMFCTNMWYNRLTAEMRLTVNGADAAAGSMHVTVTW